MEKNQIRSLYKKKRRALNNKDRKSMDEMAFKNLIATVDYKKSKDIFAFVSTDEEIDSHKFIDYAIKDNKRIYVPITKRANENMRFSRLRDLGHLVKGNFNIYEPGKEYIDYVDHEIAELVLVPGLAFDKNGYRIGYGGGFYDSFFQELSGPYTKIGYCYSIQLTDLDLNIDHHDIAVDYVITD